MTHSFPIRLSGLLLRDGPKPDGLCRLAEAALRTTFYSNHPSAARLRSFRDTRAPGLRGLPVIELNAFYERFREFENHAADCKTHSLGGVWDSQAYTVAVRPWFTLAGRFAAVDGVQAPDLQKAECVAGPAEALSELANGVLSGAVRLPKLRYAAVICLGISRRIPKPAARERMWRAFRVPVYAQFRGFRGELLAAECELRKGLHIHPENAIFEQRLGELLLTSLANLRFPAFRLATGIAGRIDTRQCPCGNPQPRLMGLSAML